MNFNPGSSNSTRTLQINPSVVHMLLLFLLKYTGYSVGLCVVKYFFISLMRNLFLISLLASSLASKLIKPNVTDSCNDIRGHQTVVLSCQYLFSAAEHNVI